MSEADMNEKDDGEISRIYAATPRDEPSAAMDEAILASAHNATPDKRAVHANSFHWTRLSGIAATLVIAASLAVLMQDEQPDIAVLAPPSRDAAIAPMAKVQKEALQPAETAQQSMAPGRGDSRTRDRTDRPERNSGPVQSAQQQAPPEASPSRADTTMAPDGVPERRAFPAAPAPASSPASAEPALQSSGVAAAGVAAHQYSGATAERSRPQSVESTTRNLTDAGASRSIESPQAWLARIEALRKQGRIREADDSFAEFRKRYPDFPLPGPGPSLPNPDR